MSLDGFIAGPDDDMSGAFRHAGDDRPGAHRDGARLFVTSTLRASFKTLDVSASGQIVNLRLRADKGVA
jgi:hypothetical protein